MINSLLSIQGVQVQEEDMDDDSTEDKVNRITDDEFEEEWGVSMFDIEDYFN